MNYYIKYPCGEKYTAGSKARIDVDSICAEIGFHEYTFPAFPEHSCTAYQKIWMVTVALFRWLRLAHYLQNDDFVLLQYPLYAERLYGVLISLIRRYKKVRFCLIIHDIHSLRMADNYEVKVSKTGREIKRFMKAQCLICHNKCMKDYLVRNGMPSHKIYTLDVFDYICNDFTKKEQRITDDHTYTVTIAGNLAKSKAGYIYQMSSDNLTFHLYGPNFLADACAVSHVYHGSISPEKLPEALEGSFGLVWDGDNTKGCSGNTGKYLRYNNPHKLSLYLAANMPVIVWNDAAIADFVEKNHVGILVERIDNLAEILKSIPISQYKMMCENAAKVGSEIRKGGYLKKCLNAVLSASDT